MNAAPPSHLAYSVVGDRYTFLLTGADTGGTHAVFEFYVPAGSGSPPHVHQREDEAFYVVDGEFEFTVAGEPVRVAAGGFLLGRRGVPHNFQEHRRDARPDSRDRDARGRELLRHRTCEPEYAGLCRGVMSAAERRYRLACG